MDSSFEIIDEIESRFDLRVEEIFGALAERDRLDAALERIEADGCSWEKDRDIQDNDRLCGPWFCIRKFKSDDWCDSCIAHAARHPKKESEADDG